MNKLELIVSLSKWMDSAYDSSEPSDVAAVTVCCGLFELFCALPDDEADCLAEELIAEVKRYVHDRAIH